jgi:hypothetical protein
VGVNADRSSMASYAEALRARVAHAPVELSNFEKEKLAIVSHQVYTWCSKGLNG